MSSPAALKIWHVFVGFLIGGTAAQMLGVATIALYATVVHGRFTYLHLFNLSVGERLFCAAVPALMAAWLWRTRAYVSAGMLGSALVEWLLTAPASWAK
jgi:hypothetical protein